MRVVKFGNPRSHIPLRSSKDYLARTCEYGNCSRPHYAKGFCSAHYMSKVLGPRRRLRIEAARLSFAASELKAKMSYWGDKCWVCGGPAEAIDHVKPVSRGGPHMLANFRPICRLCNSRKSNIWPLPPEYRHSLPSGHVGGSGSFIKDATFKQYARLSESEEDRQKRFAIEDAAWEAEWVRTAHLKHGFETHEAWMAELHKRAEERRAQEAHEALFREVAKGEYVSVEQMEIFDA